MADCVYDCAVVGAGVLGSSTAYQLAKDGYNVLLLDQFALPHSRGSSHGAVRLLRYPYTDHKHNVAMPEQYHMWHQLEKEARTVLTHSVSMLLTTPSRNEVFQNKLSVNRSSGLACSELGKLDKARLKKKYPMLEIPDGWAAFLQDECLIIDAHKAVQSLQNHFVKHGGTIRDGAKVLRIVPGPVVDVHTEQGGLYRAKGVVLAPGPWAPSLLRPLGLDLPLKAWRVNVCYFKEKVAGSHSKIPFLMCDLDDNGDNKIVVFPSREYPGLVKINYHLRWNEIDPDRRESGAHKRQTDIEGMKAFVKTHLPGLEPEPAIIEPCLYTCTAKEELIVGTHPLHSNIAIGCSMSGTGFKMAPLLGKVLGEMALGKPPSFDTSLIGIKRFASSTRHKL